MQEKPTCPKCGSDDVTADASVYWGGDGWDLADGNYDEGYCQTCENSDPVTFVWVTAFLPVPS